MEQMSRSIRYCPQHPLLLVESQAIADARVTIARGSHHGRGGSIVSKSIVGIAGSEGSGSPSTPPQTGDFRLPAIAIRSELAHSLRVFSDRWCCVTRKHHGRWLCG